GKEQRLHLADLIQPFCEEVFISVRRDQQQELASGFKTLPDSFTDLGPYGAILSAFRDQPDTAWLVVACDLLPLDEQTVRFLIDHRNPSSVATAFINPQ